MADKAATKTESNGTAKCTFQKTVDSLMQGMEGFVSAKTVVGEPITIGDTIILPLVDVSFGLAAGSFAAEKKKKSAGGVGGKLSPSAVLVIQDGTTRMVSVKNQDNIAKLLDMIPDYVNKFMRKLEEKKNPEKAAREAEAREAAAEDLKEKLNLE